MIIVRVFIVSLLIVFQLACNGKAENMVNYIAADTRVYWQLVTLGEDFYLLRHYNKRVGMNDFALCGKEGVYHTVRYGLTEDGSGYRIASSSSPLYCPKHFRGVVRAGNFSRVSMLHGCSKEEVFGNSTDLSCDYRDRKSLKFGMCRADEETGKNVGVLSFKNMEVLVFEDGGVRVSNAPASDFPGETTDVFAVQDEIGQKSFSPALLTGVANGAKNFKKAEDSKIGDKRDDGKVSEVLDRQVLQNDEAKKIGVKALSEKFEDKVQKEEHESLVVSEKKALTHENAGAKVVTDITTRAGLKPGVPEERSFVPQEIDVPSLKGVSGGAGTFDAGSRLRSLDRCFCSSFGGSNCLSRSGGERIVKPISKQQEISQFKNGTEKSLFDSLSVVEANGEKWVLVDARKTFVRTEKALTNMPLGVSNMASNTEKNNAKIDVIKEPTRIILRRSYVTMVSLPERMIIPDRVEFSFSPLFRM